MSNVSLKKVYKKYGKAPYAVRDFNLEIEDKEFIVLVGPSGCGKSTTLRMIAGLEDISEGEIFIEDKLVNEMEPKDRDIAMVFQNYALYPHMSVYDNMAFALKLRKFDKKTIHERVNEAAGILGIQDLLERKPKTLSGGQRQRVAIGRAIVRNPKVFLMDEPLSNLDAKLRNQMRAELIQLRKRINTTFVYVTHDQIEAMTLGDRIVIMKDAEVQQIDKPQNVYKRPANVFVAGFIGTPQMNFFENGRLVKANGRYFIEIFGNSYDLPSEKQEILAEKNQQNCDIILGIRPEDAQISSGRSSVKAVVDLYELMGNEIYLHITIDSQQAVLRTRATTQLHEADELEVQFIEEHMHIFDKNTKMNLL